jgi:nitrate reductase NapAB chaperone NapD
MAQIQRIVRDVPQDQVAIQKGLLEVDGFVVQVQDQGGGLVTLIGTKDDGDSEPQSDI